MAEAERGVLKSESDGRLYKTESTCLRVGHDDEGGKVELVVFKRDEGETGDIDASAARILGIPGERVRCHSLPGPFDKKMNLAMHMYIDLEGIKHNLPHNTNATQMWLSSNLPNEALPQSISGPVLITADDIKTEDFVDLTLEHWEQIKKLCKEVCECAVFLE